MGKNRQSLRGEALLDWSEEELSKFQEALISWFQKEGKTYPWRETSDPYAILVSELMLQQTRIATVLERRYFERWLEKFPSCEALAAAEEEDLLKAWEGLGYYNRARNLQKSAREVVEVYGGKFPDELDEILALPGVGRYTAGAVCSFAFNKRAPIVDGNVTRVLARLFGWSEPVDSPEAMRFFWEAAEGMTPDAEVRAYNSAIMELGQTVCTRSSPECDECPVSDPCVARAMDLTSDIPRKKKKPAAIQRDEHVVLVFEQGKVLLVEESGSRRKGLWRLPELQPEETLDLTEAFRFTYAITKYKVTLHVYEASPVLQGRFAEGEQGRWYSWGEGASLPPMGSPYLKALDRYRSVREELNLTS